MFATASTINNAERRRLYRHQRWLRYVLFIVVSYHTLLDVLKLDAYNAALLDHFLPAGNRTAAAAKDVVSVLVINEVSLAVLQMLVIGLLEQLALPSVWCVINLAVSSVGWVCFDAPLPTATSFAAVFAIRALNVRQSMMVHWLGPRYHRHTIAVQFFVCVLPHMVRVPLIRLVPDIVFGHQLTMLYIALGLHGLLVCCILYGLRHRRDEDGYSAAAVATAAPFDGTHRDDQRDDDNDMKDEREDRPGCRHKRWSWLCNLSCSLFLAGVYFDLPMVITYAHLSLGYDLVYDMVYVHLCLYVTVFSVNVLYTTSAHLYRLYLWYEQLDRHTRQRRLVAMRVFCVWLGMLGCVCSRLLFLIMQIQPAGATWLPHPQTAWFALVLFLAGLGGNVQPLLAEFMFRQRSSSINWHEYLRCNTHVNFDLPDGVSRWTRYSEQLFRWTHVDGHRVIIAALLVVWLLVSPYVEAWWFTANALAMLMCSGLLFLLYHRHSGRFVRTR